MKLPSYSKMTPSGSEWLGEVPEHWILKPLKRFFWILNGSTPKSGEPKYWDGDIPWATPDDLGSLKGDKLQFTQRMITKEGYNSCGTKLAPAGSLILSTRAPIGHLAISGVPTCTNQGCRSLVFCIDDDKRYFYYQLLTTRQEFESWGQGSTFTELGKDKLGAIYLIAPPQSEQRAIATFLDRETVRIDTLIEKKERQIELLQEKRAALISNAVTKGLNPNVTMKDSGIEWLGEVPEHWSRKRIKHLGSIRYGLGEPPAQLEDGVPFIRATDIYRGRINGEAILRVDPDDVPWSRAVLLRRRDILVVRSGAYTGDSAIIPQEWEGSIAGYDLVLRLKRECPEFWAYALLSRYILQGQIYLARMRAAQPHLNAEELGEMIIVVPPLIEQQKITAYLDSGTADIDSLSEKIQHSVDLLFEYRSVLISSAVTGKIDMRRGRHG